MLFLIGNTEEEAAHLLCWTSLDDSGECFVSA